MFTRPWTVKPSSPQLNLAIPRANVLGGYWPMHESGARLIHDISGNQNDLALGNATDAASMFPGRFGGSFWGGVTSENWLQAASSNRASLTPSIFTVEAWVYLESNEGSSGAGVVSCWLSNVGFILGIWPTTNPVQFFLNGTSMTSSGTVPLKTWTHIVGVYDGTNASIYINGKLDTGPSARTYTPNTSTPFTISQYGGDLTTFVPGRVDLVAIYKRALTTAEILDSYNNPLGMFAPARMRFAIGAGAPAVSVDMWGPLSNQPYLRPRNQGFTYPHFAIDAKALTRKEPVQESDFHPSIEAPQRAWGLRRKDTRYQYQWWIIDPKQLTESQTYITGSTGISAPAPYMGMGGTVTLLSQLSLVGVRGIPAP